MHGWEGVTMEAEAWDPRQCELLRRIMQLTFQCVDLQLFLDTHPSETRALEAFRTYARELQDAKAEYEQAYGPLLNYGFGSACDGWNWIADPWPWEINWRRGV